MNCKKLNKDYQASMMALPLGVSNMQHIEELQSLV